MFVENLRAPGWMFAFLGLMLGAVAGGLTAVGIRNLTGEPLISGPEALIFYVTFAIGIIGIVYVMLNSTLMETRFNDDGVSVTLGVLGTQRSFAWDTVIAVRSTSHNIARHGGRGNPFVPSARRSWMMYGTSKGIEMEIAGTDGTGYFFISSANPDELANSIEGRIATRAGD